MQGEHDWYVSLMSLDDMIAARKHIPGIPTDTRSPNILEKALISAFNMGYRPQSGKRSAQPRILIRDFYKKCAMEYIKRNKEALNDSFEAFLLNVIQSRVRPYMKVALFSFGYPDEFERCIPFMMANKEEDKPIFEGIIEKNVISEVDKIAILLGLKPVKSFIEQMNEIQSIAMDNYKDEWLNIEKFTEETDDTLFYVQLSKWEGDQKWLGVFSFLTKHDRYKRTEYAQLLSTVLVEYNNFKQKLSNNTVDIERMKNQELENNLIHLQSQYNQLKIQLETLQKEFEEESFQSLLAQEQIAEASVKGELYNQFIELLKNKYKDNAIVFLTDEESLFPAQFCDSKIVRSTKDIKEENIVFVDRSAFPSSKEYISVLQELMNRRIQHVEIVGYNPLDQLRQVFDYYLEEREIYE